MHILTIPFLQNVEGNPQAKPSHPIPSLNQLISHSLSMSLCSFIPLVQLKLKPMMSFLSKGWILIHQCQRSSTMIRTLLLWKLTDEVDSNCLLASGKKRLYMTSTAKQHYSIVLSISGHQLNFYILGVGRIYICSKFFLIYQVNI